MSFFKKVFQVLHLVFSIFKAALSVLSLEKKIRCYGIDCSDAEMLMLRGVLAGMRKTRDTLQGDIDRLDAQLPQNTEAERMSQNGKEEN